MPGTETANVTETRQLEAQLTEEHAQVNTSATLPQVTTNEAVNTISTTLPSQDATRDDGEALEQKNDVESPGVSASGSLPPSEIVMKTRINAGGTTEAPAGMQREHHPEVEGEAGRPGPATPVMLATESDIGPLPAGFQPYTAVIPGPAPQHHPEVEGAAGRSGPAAPSHFTPWLPNSTQYASPYVMLATESDAGPLPAGFQPYAAVLPGPAPQWPSTTPFLPPSPSPYLGAITPPQGYTPVAPAFQPLIPSPSYAQSPFVPSSVSQGRGDYGQNLGSPYYPARGPIRRRREVYVSQDPFHKWDQRKSKPVRASGSLPPTRTAEYPARPTWYPPLSKIPLKRPTYDSQASTPYAPMPYPPRWSQPPLAPSPDQRQETHHPQRSKVRRYIPGIMPSELSAIMRMSPSGRVSVPLDKLNELLGAPPSPYLETSRPPSPRTVHIAEPRGYSSTSPVYSAASDVSSPTSVSRFAPSSVVPDLPADNMIALPPPHELNTGAASPSTIAVGSANAAAPSVHSAPSPTTPTQAPSIGDHASFSSKRSDTPDRSFQSPFSDGPVSPQFSSDVEKQDSRPYHPAQRGIGRMIPKSLRSWGQRVSRWAMPLRRHHRMSSRPVLYSQDEEYENNSGSDEKSGLAAVIEYTTQRAPTYIYLVTLLFLPSFYQSRISRLFDEAELTMPEIEEMAILTSLQAQNLLDEQVPKDQNVFPLPWIRLKSTWEQIIDSLLKEWKTLNVISVLLLSAVLTILQIDDAANDYLIRYTSLLSFICSLMSLLFGCMYIIRFPTMRKTYKAAEWAQEIQDPETSTWWNVFTLLALPSVWLIWSILLCVICIMSYIWRTAANVQEPPPPLSDQTVLKIRIGFTILLGFALVCVCFILATFRRYGRAMDVKWADIIENWRVGGMYSSGGPPASANPVSPHPYGLYPAGTVFNSVPMDIHREGRFIDESRVRFRDNESYIPTTSASSDSTANTPHWLGEHYRNTPTNTRERGTGSYDIYQTDFSSRQPDPEAASVSATQADTLSHVGPTHPYPERQSQTAHPLHPSELPLQRPPDSFWSPVRDETPSVTPTSLVSLQHGGHPPSQVADIESPSGRAASIIEDQRGSPTEPSSPGVITAKLLLPEAPDEQAALATYTSKQDTRTISSTHSLSLADISQCM